MAQPPLASDIAIVIPAYNEEMTIHDVAARALAVSPLVIVVDDGSADNTITRLDDLPIQLIKHEVNQGKAASLWDGITLARQYNVKYIITLDGDGQHAPEDIPKLLAKLEAHPDHIIIGARLADKSVIPAKRYYANRIANFWLAWAAGYPLSDSQSGFRIYPVHLFDDLKISISKRSSFVFESEILIKAAQRGIRSTAVAIPAVYAETARPSHFRGVRDITFITLMVARSLLERGLYLQGLYRSAIKPHLLPAHKGRLDYAGYLMAALSLLIMLLSAGLTLLISLAYTWWVAKTTPANANGKYIIVLGKRLQNNVPDFDYRQRLDRAVRFSREIPIREFYLLGGTTGNADISESLAGLQYLESKGVNPASIHLEQSSRNTLENLKQLSMRVEIPDNRIVLITNRYHLARAGIMARQFGYNVELCAAESDEVVGMLGKLAYLGEAVLLHWFLTGLLYAKATRNQAMLIRICR
jgi:glycosyltransferase involved in cell wall biosynthesis